eukprot:TRINITY_DN6197_c0_g1_i10.p1 TRINITY_DN6197_c0_g1~~TRINITY_DN6197_c0_g1_i10.p1  ORF type:complete len:251 (+),score=-11.51 TRINITY_DN6197_c0_g1_i10:1484-2236(+)
MILVKFFYLYILKDKRSLGFHSIHNSIQNIQNIFKIKFNQEELRSVWLSCNSVPFQLSSRVTQIAPNQKKKKSSEVLQYSKHLPLLQDPCQGIRMQQTKGVKNTKVFKLRLSYLVLPPLPPFSPTNRQAPLLYDNPFNNYNFILNPNSKAVSFIMSFKHYEKIYCINKKFQYYDNGKSNFYCFINCVSECLFCCTISYKTLSIIFLNLSQFFFNFKPSLFQKNITNIQQYLYNFQAQTASTYSVDSLYYL